MKCLLRCGGALLGVAVLLMMAVVLGANHVASWLSTAGSPAKADVIIVLAGEPARAIYGADLYVQGFAGKVYISRPIRLPGHRKLDELGVPFPRAEEVYRQVLIKKGVPDKDIGFFGEASVSTLEEALAVRKLTQGSNWRLLIVTSPYHARRTLMIFQDKLPGAKITVVASPYEPFPVDWWKDQNAARNVLLEVVKILFYRLGGGFYAAGSTPEHAVNP